MTRKRTLVGSGCAHFVTFSTFGRRKLLSTSTARRIVMDELNRLAEADRVRVTGFVIMPEHVHALLWFRDDRGLAEAMNVWKAASARELRKWHEASNPGMIGFLQVARSGRERVSFWQRRYYDLNLWDNEKVGQKLDYMHYNPVKPGAPSILKRRRLSNRGGPPISESARGWVGSRVSGKTTHFILPYLNQNQDSGNL